MTNLKKRVTKIEGVVPRTKIFHPRRLRITNKKSGKKGTRAPSLLNWNRGRGCSARGTKNKELHHLGGEVQERGENLRGTVTIQGTMERSDKKALNRGAKER